MERRREANRGRSEVTEREEERGGERGMGGREAERERESRVGGRGREGGKLLKLASTLSQENAVKHRNTV